MNSSVYYLSDDELTVLGSFLGKQLLYGVESSLFKHWELDDTSQIIALFNRLQERGLFTLDFDGKLHLSSKLYQMIETICHPSRILKLETTTFRGNKEVIYYYEKNHQMIKLKRQDVLHQLSQVQTIFDFDRQPLEINETMTEEMIETVNEYLDWFDEEGALNYLQTKTSDARLVLDIFNNNYDQTKVNSVTWDDQNNMIQETWIVGMKDGQVFEWEKQSLKGGAAHLKEIYLEMIGV